MILCSEAVEEWKKIGKLFSKIKGGSQLTFVKPFYLAALADLKIFKIPFPYLLKLSFFKRQEDQILMCSFLSEYIYSSEDECLNQLWLSPSTNLS